MKPETLFETMEEISPAYIAEAAPKQNVPAAAVPETRQRVRSAETRAKTARTAPDADWETVTHAKPAIWQRTLTGTLVAASLAVFLGGGWFIMHQNDPSRVGMSSEGTGQPGAPAAENRFGGHGAIVPLAAGGASENILLRDDDYYYMQYFSPMREEKQWIRFPAGLTEHLEASSYLEYGSSTLEQLDWDTTVVTDGERCFASRDNTIYIIGSDGSEIPFCAPLAAAEIENAAGWSLELQEIWKLNAMDAVTMYAMALDGTTPAGAAGSWLCFAAMQYNGSAWETSWAEWTAPLSGEAASGNDPDLYDVTAELVPCGEKIWVFQTYAGENDIGRKTQCIQYQTTEIDSGYAIDRRAYTLDEIGILYPFFAGENLYRLNRNAQIERLRFDDGKCTADGTHIGEDCFTAAGQTGCIAGFSHAQDGRHSSFRVEIYRAEGAAYTLAYSITPRLAGYAEYETASAWLSVRQPFFRLGHANCMVLPYDAADENGSITTGLLLVNLDSEASPYNTGTEQPDVNFLGGHGDYHVILDDTQPGGFMLCDDIYAYFGSFAATFHQTDNLETPAKPFDLQALLCGAGETCCVNGDRIYIFSGSNVDVINPDGSRAPFFSLGDADVVLDGLYRSADGQHIVFTGRRQSDQCLTTFAVPVTDGVFGEASESVGWSHGQIQADADGFWYLTTFVDSDGVADKYSEMHYRPFAPDYGRSLTALGAPYEWTKDGDTFYYTSETDQLYRMSRPAGKRWYDGNGADTTVLADLTGADSLHLSGGYLFAVYGGRIDVIDRAGKVIGALHLDELDAADPSGGFSHLICDGSRVYLTCQNNGSTVIFRADIKDLSNVKMYVAK